MLLDPAQAVFHYSEAIFDGRQTVTVFIDGHGDCLDVITYAGELFTVSVLVNSDRVEALRHNADLAFKRREAGFGCLLRIRRRVISHRIIMAE